MNHKGWLRVIALIVPYIFIVGGFQIMGYKVAQIPFDEDTYLRTTEENLIVHLFDLLGTFLLIGGFMKLVDKEPFMSVGLYTKSRLFDICIGLFMGLAVMSFAYVGLYLGKEIVFINFNINVKELTYTTLLFIIVAIVEEVLCRGYILKNLMLSFNKYLALVISSIIFALMHGANPNVDTFSLVSLFVAGLALGASYMYTKNLWFPIAYHFSWNLFQTLLGFNVSGMDIYSIVEFNILEENSINGGKFGFEGSIFSLLFETLLVFAIIYYYTSKKKVGRNERL